MTENGESNLENSLQDVISRYSFMDLWPCSTKDLDHLARQEVIISVLPLSQLYSRTHIFFFFHELFFGKIIIVIFSFSCSGSLRMLIRRLKILFLSMALVLQVN